jgi:threonine dehydrogenase-like Zn-dependent dehydrogenase
MELTKDIRGDSVIECVVTEGAMTQAIRVTRPGGYVSYVGIRQGDLWHADLHVVCCSRHALYVRAYYGQNSRGCKAPESGTDHRRAGM